MPGRGRRGSRASARARSGDVCPGVANLRMELFEALVLIGHLVLDVEIPDLVRGPVVQIQRPQELLL